MPTGICLYYAAGSHQNVTSFLHSESRPPRLSHPDCPEQAGQDISPEELAVAAVRERYESFGRPGSLKCTL